MTELRVYTTEQAAALMAIRPQRLRRLRRQGAIHAANIGTPRRPEWRYTHQSIVTFLRERTT